MDNPDNLIDDEGFEPFFSREEMMTQHYQLIEAEAMELASELREARRKIATLVLMWTSSTKELTDVKKELHRVTWALSAANVELSKIATAQMVQQHREYNPDASD